MHGWQAKKGRTCALPVDKGYTRKCKITRFAGENLFDYTYIHNKSVDRVITIKRAIKKDGNGGTMVPPVKENKKTALKCQIF